MGKSRLEVILDRLPGWPSERMVVTLGIFALAASMLKMAEVHTSLWDVELFKALLTLVVGSGIINMVLAFHFAANKSDEAKTENTAKMADAMKAVAENTTSASPADQAANAAGEVAKAAEDKADEFRMPEPVDYHRIDDDPDKEPKP